LVIGSREEKPNRRRQVGFQEMLRVVNIMVIVQTKEVEEASNCLIQAGVIHASTADTLPALSLAVH
jgi:hypothetical protein